MKLLLISILLIKLKILYTSKRKKINVYVIISIVLSFDVNQNVFVNHKPLTLNHSYLFQLIIIIDFQFETFMLNVQVIINDDL